MPALFNVVFDPCHVALSNVNTNGSIDVLANDTPVLVAVVPLATGLIPLDAPTLEAQIELSFDAFANDGSHVVQARGYPHPLGHFLGNATLSSIAWGGQGYGAMKYAYSSKGTNVGLQFSDFVETLLFPDANGDVEVTLKGLSAGGKAFTFKNLSVAYRIFGSK